MYLFPVQGALSASYNVFYLLFLLASAVLKYLVTVMIRLLGSSGDIVLAVIDSVLTMTIGIWDWHNYSSGLW